MSTASGRKAKRRATAAARKARRQKIFAFGGLGVLALLLVIQGPKMLELFGGSDAPVAAPAPAPPAPAPTEEEEQALQSLPQNRSDPFATRSLADHDPQAGSVAGPSGTRDPFAKTGAAARSVASAAAAPAPIPGRIVVGTPASPDAVAERAWIVVMASIRTSAGRAYAERVANTAKSRRLGTVSVLDSSTRKPLRSGYYVVYTGPFDTLSAVQRSASQVRGSGYRTAYVREILVYSNR